MNLIWVLYRPQNKNISYCIMGNLPETKLREERGLSGCRKGLKTVPLAQALLSRLKPAKTNPYEEYSFRNITLKILNGCLILFFQSVAKNSFYEGVVLLGEKFGPCLGYRDLIASSVTLCLFQPLIDAIRNSLLLFYLQKGSLTADVNVHILTTKSSKEALSS